MANRHSLYVFENDVIYVQRGPLKNKYANKISVLFIKCNTKFNKMKMKRSDQHLILKIKDVTNVDDCCFVHSIDTYLIRACVPVAKQTGL